MRNLSSSWISGFDVARATSLLSNAPTEAKRMGAALYSGSTLLSVGYNVYDKTHPRYVDIDDVGEEFCRNTHAELMALTRRKHRADKRLILYIYRETKDGNPAHSKPCSVCMKIIKEYGVKRIRYVGKNGEFLEKKIS